MIPYPEGKYRPASVPFMAGYYPYNMYLQKGKVLYQPTIFFVRFTNGVLVVFHRMVLGVTVFAMLHQLEIDP